MAFLDHNGEGEFPFSKDRVFSAMCTAIPTIKGMQIENADKFQGRILVKAGVSLYSWGENIPIQLTEIAENKTKVQIISSPKTGIMFGGAFDMGKNRKNIEGILSATSSILSSYKTETLSSENNQTTNSTNHSNYSSFNQKNMEENYSKSNAWYEKTWLVIIFCIVFFPIGLYALWKNSSISKGWKIGVTAIIALIVIANLEKKDETLADSKVTPTETNAEVKENINGEEFPKEETTKWVFQADEDKMTSKQVNYASITANDELEFDFPYNGGSVAALTIRKKDGVNNIYLSVSKGQFNGTFDGGYVRIKFDNEQPRRFSFSAPSDGSTDMIFINSEKQIISKLKSSKKIIIEAEFYNEGNRQMEFDVAGFKWQ